MSEGNTPRTEKIGVRRTALVALLGPEDEALSRVRELWYVLHGYGMRAVPFIRDCHALDDGARLVVAPEALSRFYEGELATHRTAPVGASWMTRDERLDEISDYLAYLDTLHASVAARFTGDTPEVTVLGFSQGGATAARWVAGGTVAARRLILWGSGLAPELDVTTRGTPLRAVETTFVAGTTDIYITPKIVEKELGRLRAADFPFRLVAFQGGHRLDDATLAALKTP